MICLLESFVKADVQLRSDIVGVSLAVSSNDLVCRVGPMWTNRVSYTD